MILSARLAKFRKALSGQLFARYGVDMVEDATAEAHLLLDERSWRGKCPQNHRRFEGSQPALAETEGFELLWGSALIFC